MTVHQPFLTRRALLSGAPWACGGPILAQQAPGRGARSGQPATGDSQGPDVAAAAGEGMPTLDEALGSRVELFVDERRIASSNGVRLRLHAPVRREPAVRFDRPWEGPTSAYVTVFEDRGRFRMYYRGSPGSGSSEVTCYAESDDGIRWRKPELGLVDWQGSTKNNIVVRGLGTHNFAPFKDSRPGVPAAERYKAVARGVAGRRVLHAFASPDGLRWSLLAPEPVFAEGRFDSQNLAFWDERRGRYRCYYRAPYRGVRWIGVVESDDFRRWEDPRLIDLDPPDAEHFYTNATLPYFRNRSLYLAFPKRYFPARRRLQDHGADGISEAVFLSSRDGLRFRRQFMESWVRPGLDPRNWGDRGTMPAWGLLHTAEDELSVYVSQHYRFETAHLLRCTLRVDGFASAHAGYSGGNLVTTPLRFEGRRLVLNYSTGAGGSVRVEMQDPAGKPVAGFGLADAPDLYGDSIAETYRWKTGSDLSALAGKRVRIRFSLKDCDLYSYRFAD